jgi:anti-sigma B factor antagonist
MPDPGFQVEMIKGVPVLTAPREIDITNAGELQTALLESARHGPGGFVVDMARTQFCDTSGLHALVGARKRAQAEGSDMLLVTPGAGVQRIFAITGLDRVFLSFASREEALARLPAAGAPHDDPSPPRRPRLDRPPGG